MLGGSNDAANVWIADPEEVVECAVHEGAHGKWPANLVEFVEVIESGLLRHG